jgi:exonuclease I
MLDNGLNFVDSVSGKSVRNYTDSFGRSWMADGGRWSLFRVSRCTNEK